MHFRNVMLTHNQGFLVSIVLSRMPSAVNQHPAAHTPGRCRKYVIHFNEPAGNPPANIRWPQHQPMGSEYMTYRQTVLNLVVAALLLLTSDASAQGSQERTRSEGMSCFFAGHSFFCPVALSFDRIAKNNDFAEHDLKIVFRGGQAGTAGALWTAPKARKQIEAVLATGDVELFGLTPGLSDNEETFQRWFDLALEHNPKTRFFIGTPWAMGGAGMDTAMFDRIITGYAKRCAEVVEKLRALYPDTQIDFLAYGKMATAMKKRFDSESLPSIEVMVGKGNGAFFVDRNPGHAGPMLLDLCALTWLNELYGADFNSLTYPENEADVPAMIEEVMTFNAPFRPTASPKDEPKNKASESTSTE